MNNNIFADDINYSNFNFKDVISPFASKKNRQKASKGLNRVVKVQRDVLQSVTNPLRRKPNTIAFFSGLTLAQRMERKKRVKQISNEQYNSIISNVLGNRSNKTGFYSLQVREYLKNLRLQAIEKKKLVEALAEAKTQGQLDSLKQQLSDLQSTINKSKQDLQQQSQIPIQQVEKVVQNIEEQPQLNIDEQIEEIETNVVDEKIENKVVNASNNEIGNENIKNEETPTPSFMVKHKNHILIGGVLLVGAFLYFRKK